MFEASGPGGSCQYQNLALEEKKAKELNLKLVEG